MVNIYEILQRAASLKEETALNSISPKRAGGIMYDTLLALNDLWLQQGAALVISKIYASVAAMQADTAPVSDLTGQPLRPGQIVVIASSDSDNGSVYRYNGTDAPSWSLVGTIGNLTPVDSLDSDSTSLPLAAHQGKVLDGKISQLGQEIDKKYTKPSTGIPETDLKQDVQDLLGRAGNSVAVKLAELDGNGVIFSPSLEPFILVAMNTNDIAVYHVSASTSLTPEANIIRLVYSSASSLLKFYYYDDNVVAWSDGEVSLYYCNLSGLYYDFEFFDGSLQRLEEDGVLLPIEEFATKSDLTAKYEKPSAGIPKSDLASSVQSSLNKADTAYQKPSNGIPDTDMTESVRRCLELADSSATLNRFVIEGGHGLKFVPSTNSYLVRIENENEEFVYLISCGDDYTNTQVTALAYSIPSGVSFYLCDTRLLIWASSASIFSLISLRENGAIDSEIIDEMPEDVEEIVPGTYATDLDLADKQDIISDLSTIRSGAAAGASAVQPSAIANMETTDNKTTSLSRASTDQQYPSAKAVYDFVMDKLGDIETLLAAI